MMRFLLSEYISLLKEDKELDTLLIDLLIGMKFSIISKPMKGRQFGVDISAIGIDPDDNCKKVFLLAVKQGNLTRSTWDGNVNAVRSTLNQIKDTFVPTALTKRQKKYPIKIIVATNGLLNQNVSMDWAQYVDANTDSKIEYDFWGIHEISSLLEKYLENEKYFPEEYQSLLRKSLVFLDLPDYDLSHFYSLIKNILSKRHKQKRKILKRLRLVKLCLSIIYKWSDDNENLKPSIYASEYCLLHAWQYIAEGKHLDKTYVRLEFYNLHYLRRNIVIKYFNKTMNHYLIDYGLYNYSKNSLEYSLNIWEEIGIIATIGLTEIQEFNFMASHNKEADIFLKSAESISDALCSLIFKNPPSKYPEYDVHCVEIALALNLLILTNKHDFAKKWISDITLGLNDRFKLFKLFPLFRKNYENLVDIYLDEAESKVKSSMIIPILAEYALILKDDNLYHFIRKITKDNFPDLDLQIWFPVKEIENLICIKDYSSNEGTLKLGVELYSNAELYRKEIREEINKFGIERGFKFFAYGFDLIAHLACRHYKGQPLPLTWRYMISPQ